jgi:2-aminoadipate transaminase
MATTQTIDRVLPGLLSRRAKDLPGPRLGDPRDSAKLISFLAGFPDPKSLPAEEVIAATRTALTNQGEWALQYGATRGQQPLVEALIEKLARDQDIHVAPAEILVTSGASQALALIIDALVDWGDTVITEQPTWSGAVRAFSNAGAKPVPVPVDDEGTDVAALERILNERKAEGITPKFIYVISNFQNPVGVSTTEERRKRIIELAHEFGTFIVEDDAYSDLRYSGQRIPSIYQLDDGGTTLYMSTLSKTLGAGMRLGWVLGDAGLISKLSVLKVDGGSNVFGSYVAAEWIPNHFTGHVDELKRIYHRRLDLMLKALNEHMPAGTNWTKPDGGFFIWVTLPEGVDTSRMLPQARERGVEFLPGAGCYVDGGGKNTLRLSYSFASDEQIEPGIRILGEIAKGELLEAKV